MIWRLSLTALSLAPFPPVSVLPFAPFRLVFSPLAAQVKKKTSRRRRERKNNEIRGNQEQNQKTLWVISCKRWKGMRLIGHHANMYFASGTLPHTFRALLFPSAT